MLDEEALLVALVAIDHLQHVHPVAQSSQGKSEGDGAFGRGLARREHLATRTIDPEERQDQRTMECRAIPKGSGEHGVVGRFGQMVILLDRCDSRPSSVPNRVKMTKPPGRCQGASSDR